MLPRRAGGRPFPAGPGRPGRAADRRVSRPRRGPQRQRPGPRCTARGDLLAVPRRGGATARGTMARLLAFPPGRPA